MPTNKTLVFLHSAAITLGGVLHEAMGYAIPEADQKMATFMRSGAKYRALHSYMVRAGVREYLFDEEMPGKWKLDGNPELNGQLKFLDAESGWPIRFLKESPMTPNRVPMAGSNFQRRKIWSQQDLFSSTGVRHSLGPTVKSDELLLLWRQETDAFGLRLVHTTAPGKLGQAVPVDYALDLVVSGTLHENRRFDPDNSEENLVTEVYIEDSELRPTADGDF